MAIDVSRYPELVNLESYLRSKGLRLDDALTEGLLERVKANINAIAEGKAIELSPRDSILEFYLILLVLVNLKVRALIRKFMEVEGERLRKVLLMEKDEALLEIAESLGLKVEVADKSYYRKGKEKVDLKFSTDFISYLKAIKGIKDESVRLNRQILSSGKVLMSRETLIKILTSLLLKRLEEGVSQFQSVAMPNELVEVLSGFRLKRFPPCMENLMKKDELNEEERVNLTVFLIAVGYQVKDVVSILKEKNVENAEELVKAYMPKKRKAYLPYSCARLKELGICVSDCGVSNPLQYYFGKLE